MSLLRVLVARSAVAFVTDKIINYHSDWLNLFTVQSKLQTNSSEEKILQGPVS